MGRTTAVFQPLLLVATATAWLRGAAGELQITTSNGTVASFASPRHSFWSGPPHFDYGGNAETYMNIGEAMGTAMVNLLKGSA